VAGSRSDGQDSKTKVVESAIAIALPLEYFDFVVLTFGELWDAVLEHQRLIDGVLLPRRRSALLSQVIP